MILLTAKRYNMATQKTADQSQFEEEVYAVLESAPAPLDFGELVQKMLSRCGSQINSDAVITAAWSLIEQNRAELAVGFRVQVKRNNYEAQQ